MWRGAAHDSGGGAGGAGSPSWLLQHQGRHSSISSLGVEILVVRLTS